MTGRDKMVGEEGWMEFSGLRHFYRSSGEDRPGTLPLALIHGLGVSSDYWARLLPLLAAHRRVYAIDLPGFGRSEDPARRPGCAAVARSVIGWLDGLGVERAHILAHSQGTQVAGELADGWAERVASLTLAGATLGERDPSLPRLALRLLRDIPRERWSLLPVAARGYRRAGAWRMVRTCHLFNHEDTVRTLGRVRVPVLIVRGARDTVMTTRAVDELLAADPDARAVTIPGAPHGLHWSHPRTLASLVNAFCAEVERKS